MASAWRSVNRSMEAIFFEIFDLKVMLSVRPWVRQALASWTLRLPRRISMIRSITSQALMSPSWISFFSSSLARSV